MLGLAEETYFFYHARLLFRAGIGFVDLLVYEIVLFVVLLIVFSAG